MSREGFGNGSRWMKGMDRPLSILLAEDDPVHRDVTRSILERSGHDCAVVANGREAVDAACSGEFDLVLMDCQMPLLDGYQATAVLRSSAVGQRLPVIAVTSHEQPGDRERCIACGMDGYVSKPVDEQQLCTEITRVLRQRAEATQDGDAPEPAMEHDDTPLWSETILKTLREVNEDDPEGAAEMIELFRADSHRLVSGLRTAADASDAEEVRRLGHALFGVAGVVGAERLRSWARVVMDAGRAGDWAAVGDGMVALERAHALSCRTFPQMLGKPA